jgi:nucleotide-binding universal stress UspA family protein
LERDMHDILINTSQCRSRSASVEYGVRLAARLGAVVTGTYVYPSLLQAIPRFSTPDLVSTVLANAQAVASDANQLGGSFVEWAQSIGVRDAAWRVAEDYLPDAMANIGLWHDLFVVAHNPEYSWGSPADIASLVFATALPAVVVPHEPVQSLKLDCIVIAWNESPEATRALRASLPLLKQARQIIVLAGERRSAQRDVAWKPPLELDGFMRRHELNHKTRDFVAGSDEAGALLLKRCAEVDADLLVMGMYGRGRFSEWILGGATRHVLEHAALPVFLCH